MSYSVEWGSEQNETGHSRVPHPAQIPARDAVGTPFRLQGGEVCVCQMLQMEGKLTAVVSPILTA